MDARTARLQLSKLSFLSSLSILTPHQRPLLSPSAGWPSSCEHAAVATQGPALAMDRWVVETSTALACPAEAVTTLEGLRSCTIIHT